MDYTIINTAIYDLVDEEISRVADDAYAEDGTPLYDGIVLHSKDKAEIKRLQADAINTIVRSLYDLVPIKPSDKDGNPVLSFYVPDIDTSTEPIIAEELNRFVVLSICYLWLRAHAADKAEDYATRANDAISKASALLHTRKRPTR